MRKCGQEHGKVQQRGALLDEDCRSIAHWQSTDCTGHQFMGANADVHAVPRRASSGGTCGGLGGGGGVRSPRILDWQCCPAPSIDCTLVFNK